MSDSNFILSKKLLRIEL